MDPGEGTTGTRDEHFDLVSVLYHALQGADACGRYASDAEAAGDERLAAFFGEAQATQRRMAGRAKGMLGIGLAGACRTPPRPRPVRILPDEATCHLQGEARLARAARAGEGKEPGHGEQPPGLEHLALASNEAG